MAEKDKSNNLNQEDLKNLINRIIEEIKNTDFNTLFSTPDEEDIKNINCFLFAADDDLKASKLLYENKLYANSIYHLQQAIEKMIKAQALKFFPLDYKSITKTSHNSPEIYFRLLKVKPFELMLRAASTIIPNLDVASLDTIDQSIIDLKNDKTKLEIANLPSKAINALLIICSIFIELYGNLDTSEILKGFYGDNFKSSILDITKNLISDLGMDSELNDVNFEDIFDETIEDTNIAKMILITIPLYILGIIVYPHEAFTRYPGKLMGPENYNLELGIVQTYPKIYEMSEIILKRLKN
ncbi:HEPN domain-containing protein [Picrophilus oshimae]|uniref:Hypothetical membrane associated protein n=1 Tax=Picrophilus torridus (strain ATCC 700027 / DSM 9790 / JCM 10055 / NBRC 100828 / KAW 2/3) TaxID=1122961 RepID=Q6L2Y6_PICTO|nr:HEPN domain-containing protein [Picrophilus oshimae]AAT42665.1 hypothetical membrane associated protein [Picrophilus oshimae DSM 9789]